jgi:xylulokinase
MALVAGVDSSTQGTKIVIRRAEDGAPVREARAPHPDGTEVDPRAWWQALNEAGEGLWEGVEALAVAGQQHGMVARDDRGEVVRPALLWNDTRSAGAAEDLITELGGAQPWAEAVGLVPVASFTVTKLRWLAAHEPDNAARVHDVLLPHDYLTALLTGTDAPVPISMEQDEDGVWNARAVLGERDFVYGYGDTPEAAKEDVKVGIQDVFDHEGVPADLVSVTVSGAA